MISYTVGDIVRAIKAVGIKADDTVFFTSRIYTLGWLEGVRNSEEFCQAYFDAIFEAIGKNGTLVVPTYTRQVGIYGVPYIHETTPTLSGILNEYVRLSKGAIRSFHPVFSLTAVGAKADEICGHTDTSGFGVNSAYGNLFRVGGKALCLGFSYESGHIVTGSHYLETTYGVPYHYNKILDADVYKDGVKSNKVFILNVAYRQFNVRYDFLAYVKEVDKRGFLKSAALGRSKLYCILLEDQLKVGYEMLADNVYAFLKETPAWVKGRIPYEGCESKLHDMSDGEVNWVGYSLMPSGS